MLYNNFEYLLINVDGFECSYPARLAFVLAYKFERLAKVGTKARAAFQRVEDHGEPVAVFTVDAVLCDNLAACEDPRKGVHLQMQGVFIDFAAGLACCCDGYALNVSRLFDAQVFNADSLAFGGVILSRAFIKGAEGCEVSIYKDGARLCAVASNGASCDVILERYPNYKSVFSHIDKSAPVRLNKSIRELKKTAAAVAKAAGFENVLASGYNGDNFITISAQGDGGEVTRRVALAERLAATFAVAFSAVRLKAINNAAATFYVAQNESIVFSGVKCVAMLSPCCKDDIMTATATAADNAKTRLECIYNAFAAFAEHVAPVEDVTEDSDNTGHVAPRRVWLDWLKVAAVLLFAFVPRTVSTNESSAAPSTNSRAVVDVEPLQAVEILDTLAVAPTVPVDSIQATEGDDNADTLDVAPVAPVDSIQTTEGDDNADTLDVAPDNINQMQGTTAAAPLVASCSTSAVYPTYYEALEALGRYRPNAKLAERINGAGEAKNY